jgi:hypothetical protein
MIITDAKYHANPLINNSYSVVNCTIDGKDCSVPMVVGNTHYDEILRQVAAGTLTIADAD